MLLWAFKYCATIQQEVGWFYFVQPMVFLKAGDTVIIFLLLMTLVVSQEERGWLKHDEQENISSIFVILDVSQD